jgi:glycerate kinase
LPEAIERLSSIFEHYAAVIDRELQLDVREIPGGGASGGLGAGLVAFLNATLHSRYDIIMKYLEFDALLHDADLVFTAEGAIDFQTPLGKVPAEVAKRAKQFQLPVIALVGTVGKDAQINLEAGIDSFVCILETPCSLSDAIQNTPALLTRTAEQVMRLINIGRELKP